MTELKTLNDFKRDETALAWNNCLEVIKMEAIKWVKEDYPLVINKQTHMMLERWKRRLNITEEDLKNE